MNDLGEDIPLHQWRHLIKRTINSSHLDKDVKEHALNIAHGRETELLCDQLAALIIKEAKENNPNIKLKRIPKFIKWLFKA
jgi:hypothetical protein